VARRGFLGALARPGASRAAGVIKQRALFSFSPDRPYDAAVTAWEAAEATGKEDRVESTVERFEAMLQRGVDYDEVEAYIEAQDYLSRDQKDVLWLAWADSGAPLPHKGRSAGASPLAPSGPFNGATIS
jgi:hypothetical protein